MANIIHIQADDHSDSARSHRKDLLKSHCWLGEKNYLRGDRRIFVQFAAQTAAFPQETLSEALLDAVCDGKTVSHKISRTHGTSLILALEHILELVRLERNQGRFMPVLVTFAVHEAEPGPGQPLMDEEGLRYLRRLIQTLEDENAYVAMMGATQHLRGKIQRYFIQGDRQRICLPENIDACIQKIFEDVRNSAS